MRSGPTRLASLLVCLLAVAFAFHAATADEQGDVPTREAVQTILAALDATPPTSEREVERRLRALGADALPLLFESWGAASDSGSRDGRIGVLAAVISAYDHPTRAGALDAMLEADGSGASRRRILRVLSRFGSDTDLELALRAVSGLGPGWARSVSAGKAWSRVLSIVYRDHWNFDTIRRQWTLIPPALRVPTVRHVVEHGRASEVRGLLLLIQDDEQFVPAMLSAIGQGPPIALVQPAVSDALRRYLSHPERRVRASAVTALGRTGSRGAFDDLVAALHDPDARVRVKAHGALQILTGTTASVTAGDWSGWIQAESQWLAESDIKDRLQAWEASDIAAALRELERHRFMGAELLDLLAGLLVDARPEVRILACAAARAIGSADLATDVMPLLRDPVESVRDEARKTIILLSGRRLPPDPKTWDATIRRWTT